VAKSFISRRVSEFVGVALFALALIWFISLASYSPSDPVWFFNTGSRLPPVNFAGRIGAFVAELSYQLLGYSTYLTPIMLVVVGWHYFWCRSLDAAYTKLVGAALLFGCVSSFMSLAFGTWEISGKTFRAGGILGDRLAALLAAYLNRTGSISLILTLLFLGIILSTLFSLGRLFAAIGQLLKDRIAATFAAYRAWRDDRRREKQRQEVLKKHLDKTAKAGEPGARPKIAVPRTAELAGRAPADAESPATARSAPEPPKKPSRTAAMVEAAAAALKAASSRPTPPATIRRPPAVAPPLPLPEPEKLPAERKKGAYTLPPLALLDAPRSERKIDERELMDGARLLEEKCREFSVEEIGRASCRERV